MGWESGIIKNLNGKPKDKAKALQELGEWMKDPSAQENLTSNGWTSLINAFCKWLPKEMDLLLDKLTLNNRIANNQLLLCIHSFKDLISVASKLYPPALIESQLLPSILQILDSNPLEELSISKSLIIILTECLATLVSERSFREHLKAEEWEELVNYCIEFFLEEKSDDIVFDRADRRSECVYLSLCFTHLTGSTFTQNILIHAETLLHFLSTYLNLYLVENSSFEYFLTVSAKLLLLLDVDRLDLSFEFLKSIIGRLITLSTSRNDTIKLCCINLFRIFLIIGMQREDDQNHSPSTFISLSYRVWNTLESKIEARQIHIIPMQNFHFLIEEIEFRNIPNSTNRIYDLVNDVNEVGENVLQTFQKLDLISDVVLLGLVNTDDEKLQTDLNEPRKKRIKTTDIPSMVLEYLKSSDNFSKSFILQILALIAKKNPLFHDNIKSDYLDFAMKYVASYQEGISEYSMLVIYNLLWREKNVAKIDWLDINDFWDKLITNFTQNSKEEGNDVYILLFNLFISKQTSVISNDRMNNLMTILIQKLGTLKYSTHFVVLFQHLILKIHNPKLIETFTSNILKLHFPSKNMLDKSNTCSIMKLFQILLKQPCHESSIQTALWENKFRYFTTDKKLFEIDFISFSRRVRMVSGYNGMELSKCILGCDTGQKLGKLPITYPIKVKETIIDHFNTIILDETSKSRHLNADENFHWSLWVGILLKLTETTTENDQQNEQVKKMILDLMSGIAIEKGIRIADSLDLQVSHKVWPFNNYDTVDIVKHYLEFEVLDSLNQIENNLNLTKKSSGRVLLFELSLYGSDEIDILLLSRMELHISIITQLFQQVDLNEVQFIEIKSVLQNLFLKILNLDSCLIPITTMLKVYLKYLVIIFDEDFMLITIKRLTSIMRVYQYENNFTIRGFCIELLEVLIRNYLDIIIQNIDMRSMIKSMIEFFYSTQAVFPVDTLIDFSQLLLTVAIYDTDQVLITSFNVLNLLIEQLSIENFRFTTFLTVNIIPQMFSLIELEDQKLVYDDIRKQLTTFSLKELSNITWSLVFGTIFVASPLNRVDAFIVLLKLANDQPALDTVESILELIGSKLGFESTLNFLEFYLMDGLSSWSEDLNSFPTFLFGFETLNEFIDRYIDIIFHSLLKKRDTLSISKLLEQNRHFPNAIQRSFSTIYAYFLILKYEPSSKEVANKLNDILLQEFNNTEDVLNEYVTRYKTSISFLLLKWVNDSHLYQSRIAPVNEMLGCIKVPLGNMIETGNSNLHSIFNALEFIFSGEIYHLKDQLNAFRVHSLFHKFHVFMDYLPVFEEQNRLLANGYRVLLAISRPFLNHTLIFHSCIHHLIKYLKDSRLCELTSNMISYIIKCNLNKDNVSNICEHAIALMAKLGTIVVSFISFQQHEHAERIVNLMELLLDGLITFGSEEAKLMSYVSMVGLDSSNELIQNLRLKFKVNSNDPKLYIAWIERVDIELCHSEQMFNILDSILETPEFIKYLEKRSAAQKLHNTIVQLLKSDKVENEEKKLISKVYTKLISIVDFKMLNLNTVQIDKLFLTVSAPCYPGFLIILQELYPYLFSNNLKIVSVVIKVLCSLGSSPEGAIAFKNSELVVQKHIDIFQSKSTSAKEAYPDNDLDSIELWRSGGKTESMWIVDLVVCLIQNLAVPDFLFHLLPIIAISTDFAKFILPYVIHYGLLQELHSTKLKGPFHIKARLSKLFQMFFDVATEADHFAIHQLLKTVNFVMQLTVPSQTPHYWLDLNYASLSRSSLLIDNYLISMYFIEYDFMGNGDMNKVSWDYLIQSYKGLNDSDGLEGAIMSMDVRSIEMLDLVEQKLDYDQNWMNLWSIQDSVLQTNSDAGPSNLYLKGVLNSSHYFTLNRLLGDVHSSTNISEMKFESLWRLGKWSNIMDSGFSTHGLHKSIFNCLNLLQTSNEYNLVGDIALESIGCLVSDEISLISLLEISEMVSATSAAEFTSLKSAWDTRMTRLLQSHTFNDVEPILAVRTQMLNLFTRQGLVPKDLFGQYVVDFVNMALEKKNTSLARTLILKFGKVIGNEYQFQIRLMSLKTEWLNGETMIAMKYLNEYLLEIEASEELNPLEYSELLHLYGIWAMKGYKYTPRTIISDYLKPATMNVELKSDWDRAGLYYFDLAKYCDLLLTEIEMDDTISKSKELLSTRRREMELLSQVKEKDKTKQLYIRKKQKQIDLEIAEMSQLENERNRFLCLAVESYLKTLSYSNYQSEFGVFRLCSLWLSNTSNTELNSLIESHLTQIPSKKFVPLMYQLSARFSSNKEDDGFNFVLQGLLSMLVQDYPFHTLGCLLALKNVTTSAAQPKSNSNKSVLKFLQKLQTDQTLQPIILSMDQLFSGYIDVAYLPIPNTQLKNRTKKHDLPSSSALLRMKLSSLTPVITATCPLSNPKDFSEITYLTGFDRSYSVPGGINAPKVIKCKGSNGKIYRQLVKGKDDLRQDAVLMSVFNMVNYLLKKKYESRKRNLSIRTYNIVPLAAQAGVVHWVDNTIPLGDLLADAHSKNKKDMDLQVCRLKMKNEHENQRSTLESKLKVFENIQSNLQPVFGKLFFQIYKDPQLWFENRSRYIRSVSTTSMAGYMVGIGDRHSQNILFDQRTGEIIHIDLGIAFDQGKILSTPERVPFRLTRDMVNAMGILGTEGVYKRGCIETLKVLKDESDILFTLLDVFRHDPLYSWTITPLKLKKVQRDDEANSQELDLMARKAENLGNKDADVALFGVKKKLSSTLSVDSQIQELITNAMDPRNLCRMYPGWQPWL
ncbi:hypothetical protein BC833DRAFT_580124 [Globomyces pollinis-pini]|nr:hypothetical protein BC833DRAFT_580124 [Globomyces pollinis-pini]